MDGHPLETLLPGEAEATERLTERLRRMMLERDRDGLQRRDVHVKSHGTLRARFEIEPGLPDELRVGLFAKEAGYEAWVRLSSSSNDDQADGKRDIRGLAIKLMGVPGRKLLDGHEDETTQDLILISCPIFPTRDAAGFDGLVAAVIGSLLHKLVYFLTHPRVGWILLRTMKRHANPLELRYWSAVPFLFGDRAVKWGLMPRRPPRDKLPFDPPENQLRIAAAAHLAQGDAVFDFCVQFQRDARSMPVEDPRVCWDETASPMRKVATLAILRQDFDTDARNALGENLSFTPWHTLPEHRPLGSVNRSRRAMYQTLSALRHQLNLVPQTEPKGWDSP
jgi:hypothetical protein